MNGAQRDHFDRLLEAVLAQLPPLAQRLLQQVELIVEDYPSAEIMRDLGIEFRDDLCGLHQGVALPDRSVDRVGDLPDTIFLYREGIRSQSETADGAVDESELQRQIRITLLHELGHQVGFDEDTLDELGYG